MRISHLREFLAAADTLNFTTAAASLHISQPVLSQHIKALELEIGGEIFARNKHRIRLTKIGKVFLEDASQIVSLYDSSLEKIDLVKQNVSQTLSIGYLYNAFRYSISLIARDFTNNYPTVDLRLFSYNNFEVLNALFSGKIDIALTIDVCDSIRRHYNVVKLGEDRINCATRIDDPLTKTECLSLMDLKNESFILPHPEYDKYLADYMESIFRQAGFSPKVAGHYYDIETRYLEIEAGNGIGLVGNHLRHMMGDQIRFIPITDSFCMYNIIALWKKTNINKAINTFMEMLESSEIKSRYASEP
jgi:DNA-binding transcriptional LysR family regulator